MTPQTPEEALKTLSVTRNRAADLHETWSKEAVQLVQDPSCAAAFAALIAARRLFVLATRELDRHVTAAGEGVTPGVLDFLLRVTQNAAQKPYDIARLPEQFLGEKGVLVWLGGLADDAIAAGEADAQQPLEAERKTKLEQEIPTGVIIETVEGTSSETLARGASLTVGGFCGCVRFATRKIVEAAAAAQFRVLHLCSADVEPSPSEYVTTMPLGQWYKAADTRKKLSMLLGDFTIRQQVDLVVCDDLLKLVGPDAFRFKKRPSAAGDGHRLLSQFCREAKMACVSGVCFELEDEEYSRPEDLGKGHVWEQLRTHSTLRFALAEPLGDAGPYLVRLNPGPTEFPAERADLEAFAKTTSLLLTK